MEHVIQMKKGPHSTGIPRGMVCLLAKFFSIAELQKQYRIVVYLGEQIRASEHCRSIEVRKLDPKRNSVVIAVKPGDNGTRFNCFIFRPEGYEGTAQEFLALLQKAEEKFYASFAKKEDKDTNSFYQDMKKIAQTVISRGEIFQKEIAKKEEGESAAKATDKKESVKTEAHSSSQPETSDLRSEAKKPRRQASKVLSEEAIKKVLLIVQEAPEQKIFQSELGRKISENVDCGGRTAINFLLKKEFFQEESISERKTQVFLTEKAKQFLGLLSYQKDETVPGLEAQTEAQAALSFYEELKASETFFTKSLK